MYRSILVPLDGSPLAETALPVARDLAIRTGAALEVVSAFPSSMDVLRRSGVPVVDPRFEHEQAADIQQYSAHLEKRLAAETPQLPLRVAAIEGIPADVIVERARSQHHDLIVMTTHGRSGLSRAWLGSVADRVVRESPVPVLVLREGLRGVTAHTAQFGEVLVPVDFAHEALALAPHASTLAGVDGRIHLFHAVVTPRLLPPPSQYELMAGEGVPTHPATLSPVATREAAAQRMADIATDLSARGVRTTSAVATHHSAEEAILEYAAAEHIGLIVMGTHGRGVMERLLLGSVADKVLRGANVPVLLARPPLP